MPPAYTSTRGVVVYRRLPGVVDYWWLMGMDTELDEDGTYMYERTANQQAREWLMPAASHRELRALAKISFTGTKRKPLP